MPVLIDKGDGGARYPLVIDGIAFSNLPEDLNFVPAPVADYQDMMDAGSRMWLRRPHFDGVADQQERYSISIPRWLLKGQNLINWKLIRASGGLHRFVIWSMECVKWTLRGGVQRVYLPRLRGVAPHVFSGLQLPSGGAGTATVNVENFPAEATLNDDALTVSYAEGPTLDDPGAGGIVIAKQPDATGDATGYTAALLGDDVETGDVLMLWAIFAAQMQMREPTVSYSLKTEEHSFEFVES